MLVLGSVPSGGDFQQKLLLVTRGRLSPCLCGAEPRRDGAGQVPVARDLRQCSSLLQGVKDKSTHRLPPQSHPVYNLRYSVLHFYYHTISQALGWHDSQKAVQAGFCIETLNRRSDAL